MSCSEKLRPGSLGPVGSLKAGHLILSNLKLPDHNKHENLSAVLQLPQGEALTAKWLFPQGKATLHEIKILIITGEPLESCHYGSATAFANEFARSSLSA